MRLKNIVLVGVIAALVATSCGDSGSSSSSSTTAANGSTTTTSLTPKVGGTLTVAVFSEIASLDPITSAAGTGSTGASEQTALYDTILRFDPTTGNYENQVAASVTPNADLSVWTLKLKPNVKFSDGTDYNADAVKAAFDRQVSDKSTSQIKAVIKANVKTVAVSDPLTVVFTLTSPWGGFPVVLAGQAGRVPSPTAVAKLGDQQMGSNPVGATAGPFIIDSFKPKESLTMKRNPNYYGGQVYLDGLKFVLLSNGSQGAYDGLKSGTVQVANMRDPAINDTAKKNGFTGVESLIASASTLQLNAGVVITCAAGKPEPSCTGKPDGEKVQTPTATKSLKVRQAIAAAIDPKVINDRAYQGKAIASSALIPPGYLWDPAVAGPTYDITKAKDLVAQAKAEGWDGKLRLLTGNAGANQIMGDAVEAMLTAAGITVAKDNTKDTTAVVAQVFTAKDYDSAIWGFTLTPDDSMYLTLAQNLVGTYGYTSDAMSAALLKLRLASTGDQKKAALADISKLWTSDVPAVTLAHFASMVAWGPKVHGITGEILGIVHFEKAWTE